MEMDGPPSDQAVQRFSTRRLAPRDRIDGWRQVMARKLLNVEVDGLGAKGFRAEAWLRIFEGLRFGMGAMGAHINRRGKAIIAKDNDDFLLVVNIDNKLCVSHRGRDFELGEGDAVLLDCAEPSTFTRPLAGYMRCIRLPRQPVSAAASTAADRSARIIPHDSATLDFLTTYLDAVDRHYAYESFELRERITDHVYDLMALLLDARGDARDAAQLGGLRAARTRRLKDDVFNNLSRHDLSAETLAARHQISTRTLQRMFELESMTFTQYLLSLRLEKAYQLLNDQAHAVRSVSAIAYACGFSDVSHFNHRFRERYGASPTEIRRGNLDKY
jgi:AraC-like DNA-binding protein